MQQAMSFTGYVKHIFDADQYSREFVVANYKNELEKENLKTAKTDYPRAFKIKANIKNGSANQVDCIGEGDKIIVEFYPSGIEGVSKRTGKYYAINEYLLAKNKGITIVERALPPEQIEAQPEPDNDDDIPF